MATATVVICTYNRPEMLLRAVETARTQSLRPEFSAEILVVDNSREANARDAVLTMQGGPGLTVRYLSTPNPNISHARNAGVTHSAGDYVVFLDDDEWCELGWLDALIDNAEQTGADAVFGAVLPVFPDGMPAFDPTGRSLERRMALPSGNWIGLHHDTRISGLWIGTCNSLFRRARCFSNDTPFDPALGVVGGEDYDLFVRLSQAGRRFTWCAEAVVWEAIPGPRITMAYRRRRAFTTGQQFSTITIRRAQHGTLAVLIVTLKGVVQLALVAAQWGWCRLIGKADAMSRELKVWMVAGKLIWWTLPLCRS